MIMKSGEHLLALINEILDLSKIEASQDSMHVHAFDLHKLIQSVGDLFRHQTMEAGLAWQMSVGEGVPQYVRSDEGKLRQVLVNLVANAVKFTKSGSVSLWAEAAPAQEAGLSRHVCITVKDTGSGIAPAEMNKLFQPFSQTESGRNASEGTGLGLALSRRYIELLGGKLSATSEVGRGSSFVIDIALEVATPAPVSTVLPDELQLALPSASPTSIAPPEPVSAVLPEEPQADTPPTPAMPPDEPRQGKSPRVVRRRRLTRLATSSHEQSSDGAPARATALLRLLVVDDDFSNRRLMCSLLTSMSTRNPGMRFEVREATNGRDAVALWASWRPQVILMDIRMPGMDGLEATSLIRQQVDSTDERPIIIAVTANAFEEERSYMLANGCDDYLAKPIMISQLDAIFAQHLGDKAKVLAVEVAHDAAPPPAPKPLTEVVIAEPQTEAMVVEPPTEVVVVSPQTEAASAEPLTEAVAAERLRACPAAMIHEMHFALTIGDFNVVHQLIERIRVNDTALALYLYERAYHYDQKTLLHLLTVDNEKLA